MKKWFLLTVLFATLVSCFKEVPTEINSSSIPVPEITGDNYVQFYPVIVNTTMEKSFLVGGKNLSSSIIITVSNHLQISTIYGSNYGNTVELYPSMGKVDTTRIFVRYTATSVGNLQDTIKCKSTAVIKNINAYCTSVAQPIITTEPANLHFSAIANLNDQQTFSISAQNIVDDSLIIKVPNRWGNHRYSIKKNDDNSVNANISVSFNSSTVGSFADTIRITSLGLNYKLPVSGKASDFSFVKKGGGANIDEITDIAVDATGNSYVTGSFEGSAQFGSTTLISAGLSDIFIAKIDNSGNFVWVKQFGASKSDGGTKIIVDNSGNIYATGYFAGNVQFGSINLTGSESVNGVSSYSKFLIRMDNSGNTIWGSATPNNTSINYLNLDHSGNVLVIISTSQYQLDFGGTTFVDTNGNSIVLKINPSNGNCIDYVQCKAYFGAIAEDNTGNFYLTGGISTTTQFGPFLITPESGVNVFIARLNSNLDFIWVKSKPGLCSDIKYLCVDNNNDCYVSTYYSGTHYNEIIKWSSGGDLLWTIPDKSIISQNQATGNIISESYISDTVDIFEIDSQGQTVWQMPICHKPNHSATNDIVSIPAFSYNSNHIYICGNFKGTIQLGSTTINSSGNQDFFIAKVSSDWK